MQRLSHPIAFSLIAVVLAISVIACATTGEAKLSSRSKVTSSTDAMVQQSDRTDCAVIGASDLRSPQEGIWYQTHCLPASQFPQGVATTSCNRPSLAAAEFRQVAPGLFVFRQSATSTAYLWYATTPNCLDLVSARVVTAVCVDRAISFQSDQKQVCADHGGVLVKINGQ